jgi:hypothetical protein
VQRLLADSSGGAWSLSGSMITFAFPMILFIAVAAALYVIYTKPELVPGHREPRAERPIIYTAVPGTPAQAAAPAQSAPAQSASSQSAPAQAAPAQAAPQAGQPGDGE